MKKYAALIAVAVLFALAAPALASTNPFMDVPMNHWAYDAIGQLAARGVLSGYPDGTYKGKQPTTRYEMASALARALAVVDMTKASKQDVEMLKKLVIEFKDELDALGVKVDQIDKRLAIIEDRLGGWRLSGALRMEFYNLGGIANSDDDNSGTDLIRARLFLDRWFGEDESLHFFARFEGSDASYSRTGGQRDLRWTRFYAEMPIFWDMNLTVGRFLWDMEADYYLDGTTGFGTHMSLGNDSWLTDRVVDGLGLQKSIGLGRLSFYVGHPETDLLGVRTQMARPNDEFWDYNNIGMWEVFAMGQFQFTEQFGFDVGGQAFFGDDTADWTPGTNVFNVDEVDFDTLYTLFAGLRFNFNDQISFKGMYYYQDSGAEYRIGNVWNDYRTDSYGTNDGNWDGDSTSAFRAIIDVKQDLLKFTSLWLEYDYLDAGFVMPTGAGVLFNNTDLGDVVMKDIGIRKGSQLTHEMNIWRIAAEQKWNDKWSTQLMYANFTVNDLQDRRAGGLGYYDDSDIKQWTVGVVYRYNPSVAFGLAYTKLDFDDYFDHDDVDLVRFRTQVTF